MESCCQLGEELVKKDRIVYVTDNFSVFPTLGAIRIEGYLLICSKKHFIGTGEIPEEQHKELEEILLTTKKVLSNTYKSDIVVFEHGPRIGCYRGGGCLDHAHLHVLPLNHSLVDPLTLNLLQALRIGDYSKIERIKDFFRLKQIYNQGNASYMFVQTGDSKRYVTEVNFPTPSQYLRQIISRQVGRPNMWNWKTNSDFDTLNKTFETLEGKF